MTFVAHAQTDRSPAHYATACTPSDSTIIESRGVYIGGAGNLAVLMANDTAAVTFIGLSAGTLLPLAVQKVMATNTTATSIVLIY